MPHDGSLMSGSMRGSHFQRGGSVRGSDRSLRSHKRDIDDLALSNIMPGGTINRSMPSTPKMGAHNANQFLPSHNNGHSLQMQGRTDARIRTMRRAIDLH